MGSDGIRSCSSSSIASLSLSASASGSVYSYLNGNHKNNITSTDIKKSFDLNDEQLKLKIIKFWRYEIPTISNKENLGLASFGIDLFNLITFSDFDYPYHWFLIGVSEQYKDKDGNNKELYYLIEKTDECKNVVRYNSEDEIRKKENYNYNSISEYKETKYLKQDANIEDLLFYIKYNTSDSYDLLEDNCQDFVRCLIDHYC